MSDTFGYDYDEPNPITCKYCGEKDLWWVYIKDKWRLFNGDSKPHTCKKESPFEAVKI
jgi:hypothetical protein